MDFSADYEHSFFQNIQLNATAWDTIDLPWPGKAALYMNMTRAYIFLGYDINFPEYELPTSFAHVLEPYSVASLPLPAAETERGQISYYAAYPPLAPSLLPVSVPREQFIFYAFDYDRDTFVHDFRGAAGDFTPYPGDILYYDSITVPLNAPAGVAIQATKSPFAPTWSTDKTKFLFIAVNDGNVNAICTVKIGNQLTPHVGFTTRAVLGSVNTLGGGVFPIPDPVAVEVDGWGVTGEKVFCEAVPISVNTGAGTIYVEAIKI